MSKAFFHEGLSIEPDMVLQSLRIEGQPIDIKKEAELFIYKVNSEIRDKTLDILAIKIINSWDEFLFKRNKIREEHLQRLNDAINRGTEHWNLWRKENPNIRPLLYKANLVEKVISREEKPIDLSNANLIEAELMRATLEGANFHEANLGHANLSHAHLSGAHFCRTDLYETNLSHAILHHANLQGTQMALTDLRGAELMGCKIYGMSAWDLKMEGAIQKGYKIIYRNEDRDGVCEESQIEVDDLRVAQFIYLLLHNNNIRHVIDTITSKAVLILGRFTPKERKDVLDVIADELRKKDFVPIIFNFERSTTRDFTETVKTLTGLCLFVIVDITNPRSASLELGVTVPDYQIPFVPIIQEGEEPFSMFNDLWVKYKWMLEPVNYPSKQILRQIFEKAILDRAWKKHQELQNSKAEKVNVQSWRDFLPGNDA